MTRMMTLTGCSEEYFTCSDGSCVTIRPVQKSQNFSDLYTNKTTLYTKTFLFPKKVTYEVPPANSKIVKKEKS